MRQLKTTATFLVFLSVFPVLQHSLGEKSTTYQLRFKFKPNQFVFYEVVHKSQMDVRIDETIQIEKNETRTKKHYRIVSVDDKGVALLEPTIDHVKMTAEAPDHPKTTFDSSEPADKCPLRFRHILRTIGKPLGRLRFAANGELLLQAGRDADEQLKMKAFLIVLPDQPVAIGGTWTADSKTVVSLGKKLKKALKIQTTYRLASVKGDLATIEIRNEILTPVRDPQVRLQLIQKALSGKAVFDMKRGLIVSRESSVNQRVIGGLGPKSLTQVVSYRTEKLVTKKPSTPLR